MAGGITMRSIVSMIAAALFAACFAGGSARAQSGACNRACLEGFVDRYLDALVKHDPSAVALSANVRFTENGQRLAIGDALWRSMKSKGSYRLFVSDADAGQVAFIGTVNEENSDPAQSTPALIALRLRIAAGQITEIEQAVIRNVDAAKRVEALGMPNALFVQTIPESHQVSRAELIRTANMYFSGMQKNDGKGVYPFADDCGRFGRADNAVDLGAGRNVQTGARDDPPHRSHSRAGAVRHGLRVEHVGRGDVGSGARCHGCEVAGNAATYSSCDACVSNWLDQLSAPSVLSGICLDSM
jgi:hypothetical protein